MPEPEDTLKELVGEQLSAVTFVQDYLQLSFDGPTINVYGRIEVQTQNGTAKSGDGQFRNALCSLIAQIVRSLEFVEYDHLSVQFEGSASVRIWLQDQDQASGEAIYCYGFKDNGWFAA